MTNVQTRILTRTRAESETERLARRVGALLRPGDIIALDGELGAGKTRFVRGLLAGLGGTPRAVASPTFTLMNEYAGAPDRPTLLHIDAYRMTSLDELLTLGVDLHTLGDNVAAVEWADRLAPELPDDRLGVLLEHTGEQERAITLSWVEDASWTDRANALRAAAEETALS
jgi:tRNA threonylcarbamoyladenosine biosynthesis protein TsaE